MDFGRFDRLEAPRGQAHQMFVTTDFDAERFALHLGLGHGLTHASDRWAGKLILGIDFSRPVSALNRRAIAVPG